MGVPRTKTSGKEKSTGAIDPQLQIKVEVCRDEEDDQENVRPQARVTRSRARKSTRTPDESHDAASVSTKMVKVKKETQDDEGMDAEDNEVTNKGLRESQPLKSPLVTKTSLSPFQDLTNKTYNVNTSSDDGPVKSNDQNLPGLSFAFPPTNDEESNVNEVCMAETVDLLQNLHVSDGLQQRSEPPLTPTPTPVANEEPTLPSRKQRLGTVVVWGKLYEELCGVGLGRPDIREDASEQMGGEPNQNSDGEQPQNAKIDGDNPTDSSDTRRGKRPYNKRNRAKRDPELMTKSEHMRILRSVLRNTMQCKMRDLLGVGEGQLIGSSEEISEAIRGATSTRRRRGRRSKMNPPSTNENETEDSNAANSSSVPEENGEIPQDLDDDSMKPRTTYHELIKIALEENPEGMTVSAIYNWMSNRHPSFQMDDTRWKNSVRHNLSINPYFEKHTQLKSKGGGHIWKISEKYANCSQSRPPPMKRVKSVGRPRCQDEDTDALRREFNKVMQDVGMGSVKPELAAMGMGMEQEPLMLSQDINNMQLFAIGDYEDQTGTPCFDANGSYATFGNGSFPVPVDGQYGNFTFSEISVQGVPGEYYVVNQPVGNMDGNMSNLSLQDGSFGYLPMDHIPIASFDVSQLSTGVHDINLIEYQPQLDEQSGVHQPILSDNLSAHSDEGHYIHTGEESYAHTGETFMEMAGSGENGDTSSAD